MTNRFDQDLADKALAEEFGAYMSAVAGKIVAPIADSAKKAQTSIHESAQTAESSINSSVRKSEESFRSLIDRLGGIGIELKSTVASVYEEHETTRRHLIDLLQQHREMAKAEAAEQVQRLGQAIQSDLQPRVEALVKPIADVAAKSSFRQMELSKQIAERMLKELRDTSGATTLRLDALGEKTSQLMQLMDSASGVAERRHRQLITVLGTGVVLQIVLLVLIAIGVQH